MKPEKPKQQPEESNNLTRKEALKKAGKYAAFTASAMLTILSPKDAQATSVPSSPPAW